ncbi:hypothetical protein [Streptomyces sp. NPDC027717]|uniref:hypothetical protein n=1 Tax=Streptomyces sp. NPDC027717 TaxID=3155765 RepID=UPI00340CD3C5
MDISGTQLRAVRAALFTAFTVTLSTASHVLLSRSPLPVTTVLAVAAGVFATAYALAGRERGFGPVAALLIPLELAADTVFTTGQHACYGRAGGPVTGPLHAVGLDLLCRGGALGGPLARVSGGPDHPGTLLAHTDPAAAWLLLAAHVGVGLLAAAWLRRGEQALAELVRAVAATTFRPLLLAVAAGTARPAPARGTPRPAPRPAAVRAALLLAHSLGRRGPPCSVALARP